MTTALPGPIRPSAWRARRALVTYLYETMERCDDSYGVLGRLGREALIAYANLPHGTTGIAAEQSVAGHIAAGPELRSGALADAALQPAVMAYSAPVT